MGKPVFQKSDYPFYHIVLDQQGEIIQAGGSFSVRICGRDEVVTGDVLADYLEPADQNMFQQHLQQVFEQGNPETVDVRIRSASGEHFEARISTMLMSRELCSSLIVDITGYLKLLEVKDQSNRMFRQMFEDHSSMMLLIESDTGNIVDANHAACSFYGYSHDRFTNLTLSDIAIPDPGKTPVAPHFSTGGQIVRHRLASGQIRDMEVHSTPIQYQGMNLEFHILHDISEKRKLEESVIRNQKLESIETFARGIGHDFNNILGVISGNISLSKVLKGDDRTELLENAERAIDLARALTHQLLTYAGGGAPVPQETQTRSILQNAVNFVFGGSPVLCQYMFGDSLWNLWVDKNQVAHALQLILTFFRNGLKKKGSLFIRAENVEVDNDESVVIPCPHEGAVVQILIQTDKPLLTSDQAKRLFEHYNSEGNSGSGIEMMVAWSMIQRQKGAIEARADQASGTTFEICLPGRTPTRRSVASGSPIQGKGRIMFMDDDPMLCDISYRMLTYLGYDVTTAENGERVIELYHKALKDGKPYDIYILDLTIPGGMGGEDTIRELLKLDPDIRAIVSSGYLNDPVLTDYRKYGFTGQVSKPIYVNEISRILHDLMHGNQNDTAGD